MSTVVSLRSNTSGKGILQQKNKNTSALGKTLEKLASGYQINRAGDDAAGLAISEKMRLICAGLNQAVSNSSQGQRLIQVGEGALDEVHEMLNRMATLAEQSANGTYQDELDRESLQKEVEKLRDEIERIAQNTNFNGIDLFQGIGYDMEWAAPTGMEKVIAASLKYGNSAIQSTPMPALADLVEREAASEDGAAGAGADAGMTLDEIIANTAEDALSIVYVEYGQSATQTQAGSATDTSLDLAVGSTTLSNILKTEIVPQIVSGILSQYSAFSYLKGSAIGIGLDLYSDPSASVLAAVGISTSTFSDGTTSNANAATQGYVGYTLKVNVAKIDTTDPNWRTELEATIAHEMIHGFMDEALTAGMVGRGVDPTSLSTVSVATFPTWFIEGMAQTASGAVTTNWISSLVSGSKTASAYIQNYQLGTNVGGGGDYGSGYLACMYLGAVIGGWTGGAVTASTIQSGLNQLLDKLISGNSLDDAIQTLTNGKFTSTSNFQSTFNAAGTEVCDFVGSLITAIGSGYGGLLSGDLTSSDLAPDTSLSISLFQLDTSVTQINNNYGAGYVVLTGGSTSAAGVSPSDYTGTPPASYGDFNVTGSAADLAKVSSAAGTGTVNKLTIGSGANVTVEMANPNSSAAGEKDDTIEIYGGSSGSPTAVTLSGLDLDSGSSAADVVITGSSGSGDVLLHLTGDNQIDGMDAAAGTSVTVDGSGGLKANSITCAGTLAVNGGMVQADTITGNQILVSGAASLYADNYSQLSVVDGSGNALSCLGFWGAGAAGKGVESGSAAKLAAKLSGFETITSVSVDGASNTLSLGSGDNGMLWLDPSRTNADGTNYVYTLAFSGTDASGAQVQQTAYVQWNGSANAFEVVTMYENPYQIDTSSGSYTWDEGTQTLTITGAGTYTIEGGLGTAANGSAFTGRIVVADGIGDVELVLGDTADDSGYAGWKTGSQDNTVHCASTAGAALSLGAGNRVTITLNDGGNFEIDSSKASDCAGIEVGTGTSLTIQGAAATGDVANGTDITAAANAGKLIATGGARGAGIGRSFSSTNETDKTSSITIVGGVIEATGGIGAAGIGASSQVDIGAITIQNASVTARGGNNGGAGIGASDGSDVGDILIENSWIDAKAAGHGAGIGGGWGIGYYGATKNGAITIQGSTVSAESTTTHGSGIGSGCSGTSGAITITDSHIIRASGGDYGSGIGASNGGSVASISITGNTTIDLAVGGSYGAGIGANGTCGDITISTTGSVTATGGKNGAGIGSGYRSYAGNIIIESGTVTATGSTDSSGIGSGKDGTVASVTISGGIITADGGWTNDGGNIGGYTDRAGTTKAPVTIAGPSQVSVKAGEVGEGKYIVTGGAYDENGRQLYALRLSYLQEVLTQYLTDSAYKAAVDAQSLFSIGADGSAQTTLDYPVCVKAVMPDGTEYTWDDMQHTLASAAAEDDLYIWLPDLDPDTADSTVAKLTITDADGTEITAQVTLYEAYGLWRLKVDQPTGPLPEEPGYSDDPPEEEPEGPEEIVTPGVPDPDEPGGLGGIILQIGANYGEIMCVPRFYFSADALYLNYADVSTQNKAWRTMDIVRQAVNRVSDMRGTYGALSNRLEHNINNLRTANENLTEAESTIRDADMAKEVMAYTKYTILNQSIQAMMAQNNQQASSVLNLLR